MVFESVDSTDMIQLIVWGKTVKLKYCSPTAGLGLGVHKLGWPEISRLAAADLGTGQPSVSIGFSTKPGYEKRIIPLDSYYVIARVAPTCVGYIEYQEIRVPEKLCRRS